MPFFFSLSEEGWWGVSAAAAVGDGARTCKGRLHPKASFVSPTVM